jgi:hypothetical protein
MAWTNVSTDAEKIAQAIDASPDFELGEAFEVDERAGVAEFIVTPAGADPDDGPRYNVTIRDVG